jgi:hypothetical protein
MIGMIMPYCMKACNSALEQAASAARPWQKAHRMLAVSGGPRPVPRPPLLTAGVRSASDPRGWRPVLVILALGTCLTLEGCASNARLYPRRSDEPRNLHDTLVSIKSGTNLTVRMHDGTRTQGYFAGVLAAPDSALLLSEAERSSNPNAVPIADIAYLGERRGWTRPTQVLIVGVYLSFVVGAILGGHSENPFSN